MNKCLASFFAGAVFIACISSVKAQTIKTACGYDNAWQSAVQKDPTLQQKKIQMDIAIRQYIEKHNNARVAAGTDDDSVRIIPTVFHILQQGGTDNITDAQVHNCIQILNTDYRRRNADTVYTLIPFKPIAADTKIQFQLATVDPNGNCTNGITRTYTHRTNNFLFPYAMSIDNWPSDKYLNIWVVASINGGFLQNGQVIGIGTPPPVPSNQDGVILQYAFVGSTLEPFYAGRDADHEVGHYLSMIHIWGDANCGNDQVDDTPTQYTNTYGCPCGAPGSETCYFDDDSCGSPNPPGYMYQNYMDYTDGDCKNLFSEGQKARMRAALDLYRHSIWQQSNLVATGTDSATIGCAGCNSDSDNFVPKNCPPQADFLPEHSNICPGGSIKYKVNTTNGTPTSWIWSFPGGTPDSFNGPNPPLIFYHNQGAYHAILTVSNAAGSTTADKGDAAIVDWGFGIDKMPYSEDFDNNQGNLPGEWRVFNDDGGPAWQVTNRASHSGSYSMSVQNFETLANSAPNSIKELQSPSIDFTYVSAANTPMLTFYLSYGQQYAGNMDSLSIEASTSCGSVNTWKQLRYYTARTSVPYTAFPLAGGSGGVQNGDFVPTHNQWAYVSIPLYNLPALPAPNITITGNKNVKFRFYLTTGLLSNNVYIDDINIATTGVLGVDEQHNPLFEFNAEPNPASQSFYLSYDLKQAEDLTINLYDLQGRLIRQLENAHQPTGSYQTRIDGSSFNLASGVYILRMTTPDGALSKKLVYSKD